MSEQNSKFNEFQNNKSEEDLNTGLKVLSFCIPIAGAVIFFMKKDNEPKAAKSACYLALIGLAVGVVVQIIKYALM
jgi:uncharacterized membrane protein